ncbi:hypothetical protein [Methylobacterium sp.]|uniref:hypothetical protein n=1 Tax=Methylobacterium sp. TaxID=409 RepID=UPI003AFFA474
MASHAHSTRTPLLPQSGNPRPLLGQGLGRQLGPVTRAIRAMRAADPTDQAIAAIQEGLDRFFAETGIPVTAAELRLRIENRIEADLELLEALDGDADREADYATCEHHPGGGLWTLGRSTDDEETLCGVGTHVGGSLNLWPSHGELEAGDDTGIGDVGGLAEQRGRHLRLVEGSAA